MALIHIDSVPETVQVNLPLNVIVPDPGSMAGIPVAKRKVLYLLHGQAYTDDQWVRLGATTAADRLIANGDISPFLMVMPYERDWLPPNETKFGDVLVNELVPWIDQQYRTLPDRTSRLQEPRRR